MQPPCCPNWPAKSLPTTSMPSSSNAPKKSWTNWLANVDYVQNNGLTEASQGAPFDAIYVGGAVDSVPEILKEQLKDGGRMVVIIGRKPVQHALLLTRNGNEFSEKVLFDTVVAHLEDKSANPFGDFDF